MINIPETESDTGSSKRLLDLGNKSITITHHNNIAKKGFIVPASILSHWLIIDKKIYMYHPYSALNLQTKALNDEVSDSRIVPLGTGQGPML